MGISSNSYNRPVFHGGDIDAARCAYGGNASDWLDLSTGINPNAYSVPEISTQFWTSLPGTEQEEKLLSSARSYFGLPESYSITAAPGTQSILQILPLIAGGPQKVAIQSPTYAEHSNCWKLGGHEVYGSAKAPAEPADIAVLVNPNNPTGTLFNSDEINLWRTNWLKPDGLLIIDEAFMDVTPDKSAAASNDPENTLILKSFGKFFGLAGVRLGFVCGDPTWVSKIRSSLGPWAVSGVAAEVGSVAYADTHWHCSTRTQIANMSEKVAVLLSQSGGKVMGNAGLFLLAEFDEANAIFEHLCQNHILTRPFEYNSKWLRFGLPKDEEALNRLSKALKSLS
ncbi:threonine-phosphate decarboxylase [Sneathiella sp. P13V-1]|uniref:threonine-phosphate decarboxylase CobD n=1 Tax=Sneathiella sp. P13V-1 TaxID=2697366 RepID=UPI00187B75FC|nr:threonine-phosphate decarboxylase CobD [Sneathiella sp. P13V-1]MBE7638129.1 threonine-phosphate decarboxylase [Sneathiella sp. P13V-1]